jgi:two-component sensor histidine kinase
MRETLTLLPRRPRSIVISYTITACLVATSFLALLGLKGEGGVLGYYILFPAIFLSAVFLNRGAGTFATALSTTLLYLLLRPAGSLLLPVQFMLPLGIFVVVALGLALISAELRAALDRVAESERTKGLLFEELAHRTKNNLAMAVSLLSLEASRSTNQETRAALDKAAARVHAVASAHDYLQPSSQTGEISLRDYLERLREYLDATLRGVRPIRLELAADDVRLKTDQAISLGLIVNELVTNALKHAFPDGRGGTIAVSVRHGSSLTLTVEDDGVGYPADPQAGLGSRLTRLLSKQLGASIAREDAQPGCRVRVVIPSI